MSEQMEFDFNKTYSMKCKGCGVVIPQADFGSHKCVPYEHKPHIQGVELTPEQAIEYKEWCELNKCFGPSPSDIISDRAKLYGDPKPNLECAAALIGDYIHGQYQVSGCRRDISAHDVAIIMCLLKIARIATGPVHVPDNYTDLKGYAELAEQLSK